MGRLQRGNGPRLRLLGVAGRGGRLLRAAGRPFELQLQLELVAVDLHLELAARLAWDADAHGGLAELQVDLAAVGERPRQCRQLVGRFLPRQRLLPFHLHVRHGRPSRCWLGRRHCGVPLHRGHHPEGMICRVKWCE
jgi:hypothetical protein